jgi:hypothetical protein
LIDLREVLCSSINLLKYNVYLLLSNTTTLIKCPDYRKSLYYISFRQHVSAVKRPSSGLYRAIYVKYNGCDTLWVPIVFTVVQGYSK